MIDNRIPKPGDFYLHFKNKLYQILTIAIHSETRESLVIYQALYGDFKTFARPLDMFISEVDHEKYPEVKQRYRFQYLPPEDVSKYTANLQNTEVTKKATVYDLNETTIETASETLMNEQVHETGTSQKSSANPYRFIDNSPKTLTDFLDANTDQERLNILHQMRTYVDLFTLDSIAVCLDYVPSGESAEERYYSICKYLEMKINYESKRK